MSGAAPDPLDRIEHQAKFTADAIPASIIRTEDVLALVEIARAARATEPVLDELIAWVDTDTIGCVEVQERGEAALKALRAVNARLDNQ